MPLVGLTCSWCHALVWAAPASAASCPDCGHRADLARAACDCPRCRGRHASPAPRAASPSIDAVRARIAGADDTIDLTLFKEP